MLSPLRLYIVFIQFLSISIKIVEYRRFNAVIQIRAGYYFFQPHHCAFLNTSGPLKYPVACSPHSPRIRCFIIQIRKNSLCVPRLSQLSQRGRFYLPHSFRRNSQIFPALFQRQRLFVTVSAPDYSAFTRFQIVARVTPSEAEISAPETTSPFARAARMVSLFGLFRTALTLRFLFLRRL